MSSNEDSIPWMYIAIVPNPAHTYNCRCNEHTAVSTLVVHKKIIGYTFAVTEEEALEKAYTEIENMPSMDSTYGGLTRIMLENDEDSGVDVIPILKTTTCEPLETICLGYS
jgi:hypothetical protein